MFVFSNLATSLDGKIATRNRSLFPLGTAEDRAQMKILRRKCDAILMGASTLRSFKKPCLASSGSKQPFNVILSSSLEKISPRWEFFSNQNIQRILFANEKTPADRIRIFSQSSQVILLKKPTRKNPIAIQILNHLENLGIRRLLIEGGGGVMWDFVKYNLIDEYHVTLTPRLLGGEQAPTLIDGEGFLPHQVLNLKLLKCRVVGNEIYLTYRKLAKNS